jgi:hypothetical protein
MAVRRSRMGGGKELTAFVNALREFLRLDPLGGDPRRKATLDLASTSLGDGNHWIRARSVGSR